MIQLSKPFFGNEEIQEVEKVLKSGWVAGDGPKCKELESIIKRDTNAKHAIVVGNCTQALHLSLLACGVNPGDEVIVADYTYPASALAVLHCGAVPRFADADILTYNIDVDTAEPLVNDKTVGIMPVHTFGNPANMTNVMKFAKKHGLFVVEDAACANGASWRSKNVGTVGDVGCFSMHARKNATTGEGGFAITNDDFIAKKIRSLHYFGIESAYDRVGLPTFNSIGFNYKMSDILAAIGIEQMKKLKLMIKTRQMLADVYARKLSHRCEVSLQRRLPPASHIYQSYVVLLDPTISNIDIIAALKNHEISAQIGTYACHMQPVFNSSDICPVSKTLFEHSLALPIHMGMAIKDVEYVAVTLNNILKNGAY